jgi:putative membrane protein
MQPASLTMGDEEIAGITDALNSAFIEQARIAVARATAPEVKAFARGVLSRRSETVREQSTWETERNVMALRSPTSEDLAADGARWNARLLSTGPSEFGRAYLDQQIMAHEDALSMVETRLLPRARDPELRSLLERYRTELSADLERARSLKAVLGF